MNYETRARRAQELIDELNQGFTVNKVAAGVAFWRFKQKYEELFPTTRRHAVGGRARQGRRDGIEPAVHVIAAKTGFSTSTVDKRIRHARGLADETRDLFSGHPVPELVIEAFVRLPSESQNRLAPDVLGLKARNALALIQSHVAAPDDLDSLEHRPLYHVLAQSLIGLVIGGDRLAALDATPDDIRDLLQSSDLALARLHELRAAAGM